MSNPFSYELTQEQIDRLNQNESNMAEDSVGISQNNDGIEKNNSGILKNVSDIQKKLPKSPTPSGQSRDLDTSFQIDPDYPALCFYTIELSVTAPLLSSQDISVKLLSDRNSTPITLKGEAYLKSEQLAGLSLVSLSTTQRQMLAVFVPAGDTVILSSSGDGTANLINSLELIFNG